MNWIAQNTLSLYPHKLSAPIVRIPFSAPSVSLPRHVTSPAEPLRVLFVGSLSQRKGIAYLFDAVEQLGRPYQLTLLGWPVFVPTSLERPLNQHRWIPTVPHAEVLKVMREHDVLVFPSLFEGFALVLLEAMSQGLAVVTTHNSVGSDVISDGIDGFLVPSRSVTPIVEVLTKLSEDRDLLVSVSGAAQEKAKAFSWRRYEEEMVFTMRQLLNK